MTTHSLPTYFSAIIDRREGSWMLRSH